MPVVDAVAADYKDEVTFLSVAGRASLDATTARAPEMIPQGNLPWAWDEPLWETYEVFGQPVTFMISADGVIVDNWYGARGESEIRTSLDLLASSAS